MNLYSTKKTSVGPVTGQLYSEPNSCDISSGSSYTSNTPLSYNKGFSNNDPIVSNTKSLVKAVIQYSFHNNQIQILESGI